MAEIETKSPGLSQDTQDKLKILGGTGLGIGALALFSKVRGVGPVIKAASKVVKEKPKQPVLSEREILKNDLVKIKNQQEFLTPKILEAERIELAKIKEMVLDNPLTNGTGKITPNGGSALFDFVALHPSKKNLPAKEWANLFSNNKVLSGEITSKYIKQAGGKSKFRQNIRKEELDDLNIARYDSQGNLTDGFLKFAADQNATISKSTLLEMINNSPVNKMMVHRMESHDIFFDSLRNIDSLNKKAVATYEPALTNLAKAFRDADLGNSSDVAAGELGRLIYKALDPELANVNSLAQRNLRVSQRFLTLRKKLSDHHTELDISDTAVQGNYMDTLKGITGFIGKLTPENRAFIPDDVIQGVRDVIKNEQQLNEQFEGMARLIDSNKKNRRLPKFGHQTGYRMWSPENYYEHVAYFPDNSIVSTTTQKNKNFRPNHYEFISGKAEKTGSEGMESAGVVDVLYWTRFGKRTTLDGKKTLAIDELQSPQQTTQQLVKAMGGEPAEYARISPVNPDFDGRLYKDQIRAALDEQIEINQKAFRITPNDEKRYRELENTKKVFNNKIKTSVIDRLKRQPFKVGLKGKELEEAVKERQDFITRYELDNVDPSPRDAIENLYLQNDVANFMPLKEGDDWANDALKKMLKNAAELDADYVSINPTEYVHHLRGYTTGGSTAGNFKFYGTANGKAGFPGQTKVYDGTEGVRREVPYDGKAMSKQTAIVVKELQDLAKRYNTEVLQIDVAKSDPKKPYKILRPEKNRELYKDLGLDYRNYLQHEAAFATPEERLIYADSLGMSKDRFIDMFEVDANLYYKSVAIKVPKNMKELPIKQYKAEGGLVVDIFKW